MNRIVPLAAVALGILAFATLMLVIAPAAQIRSLEATPGLKPYTLQEQRGRDVYVEQGCLYCHSQQPRGPEQAPDAQRGWGRAAVASDYVYDRPHQLGTMRTGPDLQNVGARLPSRDWHLTHLYQPRAIFDWSIMPAYPYLFEIKEQPEPGDVVISLPEDHAPDEGVVVASKDALDLVTYLLALDRTMPPADDSVRDYGYESREPVE
jgi:cytochrome c oxidase cbb3-type subunit 2